MSKTIHFYNCFLIKNGEKTNVSMSEFLDDIIAISDNERYKRNKYGAFSLLEMIPPNPKAPSFNDRTVAFGSYRDRKPFLGNRGTDRIEEIDDDVLELTSCVFVPNTYLAIVEYNHFGSRPKHIQEYLNSFLPKDEGNNWDVEMIPIQTSKSFNDIKESRDIRNIEIKMDLLTNSRLQLSDNQEHKSLVENILKPTVDSHNELGANVATVSFGQGRWKKNAMDVGNVIKFLEGLDLESEVFASVKVKYKSPTTGKLEDVDLKNEGILKRLIMQDDDSNAFESIGNNISDFFYQKNRLGSAAWREYISEIREEELPIINNHSMPE